MCFYSEEDLRLPQQSHLIMVEGINGSGKSTFVRELVASNTPTTPIKTYRGHSFHPVDLSRVARFSPDEYLTFCNLCTKEIATDCAVVQQSIKKQTRCCGGYYWVSYAKINGILNNRCILSFAHSHEIYDGFTDISDYMDCHLSLWHNFSAKASAASKVDVHLFEGVAFQYPIMNLIGFYNIGLEAISNYINSILTAVIRMSPYLVYIDVPDLAKAIRNAAIERPMWMNQYSAWLSHTRFAKEFGTSGESGVIEFCKCRQKVERYVLSKIPIPFRTIQRHDLVR